MEIYNNLQVKVDSVINTLKFQGVEIVSVNITDTIPKFKVTISRKVMSKDINFVLTFTYWTLWTLVYGKISKSNENYKIELDYKEVE